MADRRLVVNTHGPVPGSVDPDCSRTESSFVEDTVEDGDKIEAVAVTVVRTVDAAETEDKGGFAVVAGLHEMISGIEMDGSWCRWD